MTSHLTTVGEKMWSFKCLASNFGAIRYYQEIMKILDFHCILTAIGQSYNKLLLAKKVQIVRRENFDLVEVHKQVTEIVFLTTI